MIDKVTKGLLNWAVSLIYGHVKRNPEIVKNELKQLMELEEPYRQWYHNFVDHVLVDIVMWYLEKIMEAGK